MRAIWYGSSSSIHFYVLLSEVWAWADKVIDFATAVRVGIAAESELMGFQIGRRGHKNGVSGCISHVTASRALCAQLIASACRQVMTCKSSGFVNFSMSSKWEHSIEMANQKLHLSSNIGLYSQDFVLVAYLFMSSVPASIIRTLLQLFDLLSYTFTHRTGVFPIRQE